MERRFPQAEEAAVFAGPQILAVVRHREGDFWREKCIF
jgi:hypothetical protein